LAAIAPQHFAGVQRTFDLNWPSQNLMVCCYATKRLHIWDCVCRVGVSHGKFSATQLP